MVNLSLSVVSLSHASYPAGDFYSPGESYPEYRYKHISSQPNQVYRAVRETIAQAGLDREHYGSSDWNPLGRYIRQGQNVFVLCNFVYHRRPSESVETFWSKCIHGSVLRALIDYILIAVGPSGTVRFGNAPLQSCEWEKVLQDTGAARVREFYAGQGISVEACDLRCYVAERDQLGRIRHLERRKQVPVVEIDLVNHSLLAELDDHPRFRVTDYNPGHTEGYQQMGRHVYALNRAVLEADVVFHLPKLKTHEKVGITCALKGLVGAIALKDSLAHHRFGAPSRGGDEYPTDSLALRLSSHFHDWVYLQEGTSPLLQVLRVVDRNLRRVLRRSGKTLAGAWYGNDTAWRMALDIGRLLMYADRTGTLHEQRQRRHLMLIDGVIGGEGDGPLSPSPIPAGTLLFCDDLVVGDLACCRLMGFDPGRLPLVNRAFLVHPYPLTDVTPQSHFAIVNGQFVPIDQLRSRVRPFLPPRGWRGHVELEKSA
jgi:uncharacterized protein (DUF362 family)